MYRDGPGVTVIIIIPEHHDPLVSDNVRSSFCVLERIGAKIHSVHCPLKSHIEQEN